ncbi:MAG TPA: alkaline phosphatase D family protein, partial [Polyangiaceae bacterium]|nr:alkaline phosphatase D family protein [Polyangiaceae bacterium]
MVLRLPRRRFFSLAAVTASSVCAPLGCGSDDASRPDTSAKFFPQSVASGDPRETSVVLWTRVVDPARPDQDLSVELEVSKDEGFRKVIALNGAAAAELTASAVSDHCLTVRVDSLEAGTTYYYRFRYIGSEGTVTSRTGRTRTAPKADADVQVKFGVVCCQSYAGRYFHVLRQLATYELDFVLHLGDYIYETGRASADGPRAVVFSKPEEALELGGGELAARSLDNYRDLYRLYRSDPDLQALHERFAMIVIPDDHEFSDDSHGATATYFDERVDETDVERRMASDQAWFEYMPVDYTDNTASKWQSALEFPDDLRIYRSFAFGKHLELVLTDERRYRPDHLVPEGASPGVIFALSAALPDVPAEELVPCVNVDIAPFDAYGAELRTHAAELGLDPSQIAGYVSAPWLNAQLAVVESLLPAIELTEPTLERGYAYHQLLKSAQYGRIGSRYLLAERPFYELARLAVSQRPEAQNILGAEQRAWFLDTMKRSTRTFKVWGSEVAFLSRKLDLTGLT